MTELPSGTVTFLFTDIEGSTKLLEQLGADVYGQVLSDQRAIVRAAFNEFSGTEIDTQGDAFFASFPRATEAVAAVVQIQRRLVEHPWPEGAEVWVRMGLHTGEPWLIEEGYVGMDVHRAARIGHIAHGGQVLLSETTTSLVRGELPEGVRLRDLGRHRLKDVRRQEPIHQLVIPGLPDEFPPLNSLEALPPYKLSPEAEQIVREPREVGPNPYQGLAAFTEADAPFFFGRETFTEELYDTVTNRPLTAVVVGSSGAGKSSAVAAGLLPRLRDEGGWLILRFRPGSQPFHALSTVLLPSLEPELDEMDRLVATQKMTEALRSREVSLLHIVNRVLMKDQEHSRVLLIADQFEELYTLCPDQEARIAFLDELLAAVHGAVDHEPAQLALLLTLRADFMGQALTHRPFADELKDGSLLLGPMNRDEMQAAIEKPAEKQGAAFETRLVARILDDVGDEPGNLPLLEFALTLLWDQMDQGWMTHAAYEEIGRVDGALSRHADEVYAKLLEAEQDQAWRIFVQLVQPGEGTEDTRRIARRADLVGVEWSLVQQLADERLVVTGLDEAGSETVEVVHEALIRSWGQLQNWMEADREFRRWQEGLRAALRAWEESGRDEGALLRGLPLAQAQEWLHSRSDYIGETEKNYIRASGDLQAERHRTRERRRRLILGGLAVGLVVAVLLSVFAFGQREVAEKNAAIAEEEALARATQQALAEAERERAESERGRAEQETQARATQQALAEGQAAVANARNLAVVASDQLATDPQLGLLLALQAAEQSLAVDGTLLPEAETALHAALRQASRLQLTIPAQAGGPPYVSFSPDGSRLITYYYSLPVWPAEIPFDIVTRVWDASTGELLHTFPAGYPITQWPHGDQVAIVNRSDDLELQVNIWDASDGLKLSQTDLENVEDFSFSRFQGATVNSDLSEIAVIRGSLENAWMGIWDLATGENKITLNSVDTEGAGGNPWIQANTPTNLFYSLDNDNIVLVNVQFAGPITLRIWDSDTLERLSGLGLGDGSEEDYPIAISQNGAMQAGDWRNQGHGQILIHEMGSWEVLVRLVSPQAETFTALAFSPDGALFAAASAEGRIYVWDLEASLAANSSQVQLTITAPDRDIHDLAFSPDGTLLTSAAADGSIKVWDIRPDGGSEQPPLGESFEVARASETSLALSPDGGQLAIARSGATPAVWDTETGEKLYSLAGETGQVEDLAYSPDGSVIATCSQAGPLKFWDASSGQELYALDSYTEESCALAFHPVEDRMALGFFKNAAGWYQTVELPGSDDDLAGTTGLTIPFPWRGGQSSALDQLDFDHRGNQLAGVTQLGELFVWDPWLEDFALADISDPSLLLYSEVGNQSVDYSPNGSRLVVTGIDGTVKIWDTEAFDWQNQDLAPLQVIPAHTGVVNTAAFSPDGHAVATASTDRSIKIWDIETGRNLLVLPDLAEPVTDLVFSPDGARMYAATADGTVRVYIMDDAELLELTRDHVLRSLTTQECQTYLQVEACP